MLLVIPSTNLTPSEALSYHQGIPTRDRPIIVNGKRLIITKPLESAIWDFRKKDKERRLRADGGCIDQSTEGLGERGAQVT
jgi:hypothetical protein